MSKTKTKKISTTMNSMHSYSSATWATGDHGDPGGISTCRPPSPTVCQHIMPFRPSLDCGTPNWSHKYWKDPGCRALGHPPATHQHWGLWVSHPPQSPLAPAWLAFPRAPSVTWGLVWILHSLGRRKERKYMWYEVALYAVKESSVGIWCSIVPLPGTGNAGK